MVEQDLILDKNDNVAEVLKKNFINVVSNLNVLKYHDKSVNIDHIDDLIARSIEQYKSHPSIVAIKSKSANKYFKFNSITKAEIEKEILTYRKHAKILIYQQKLSNRILRFLQMLYILNLTDP